jgi:hypothetical protein
MNLVKALDKIILQECCMNHCRDWREMIGGYPPSNHSPTCHNYKTETFFKLIPKGEKGPFLILETQKEIDDLCENREEYDITKIELTRDQFENLGEFEGF